jgi:hypothetical protein
MYFPRYSHRQPPQTVAVMQQLFGVIAPQCCRAVVFAPQPPAQPFPRPSLRLAEHARALPVVEVSTPAPQQSVQPTHCFGYAPVQRPVIELATHVVPQPLLAFGAGLNMRIPAPTAARTLPADAKTQELEALPAMHLSSLLFVELQSSRCQPLSQSLYQLASLSSTIGASSHCFNRCRRLPSLMRRASSFISRSWGMVSKYFDRSASTTSSLPRRNPSIMASNA